MKLLFIPKIEKKTDKLNVLEVEGKDLYIIVRNKKSEPIGYVIIDSTEFDDKYVIIDNQMDQFGASAYALSELITENNDLDFFVVE